MIYELPKNFKMKSTGRQFLEKTDGGLEIFRRYLSHEFNLNEPVIVDDMRFTVTWNSRYENYAIYIDEKVGNKWENLHRYNAVWFVKEKFDITEAEVYQKIDREMGLGLLNPVIKKDENHLVSNPLGLIL